MEENKINISCSAQSEPGGKDETLIPCGIANEEYGISIRHGRMDTNGELRFRLISRDGSAYIRTQTCSDSQGWQNPHYHKKLLETYIVQSGWIGYAEIRSGKVILKKYGPGELFTTEPEIIHNIYMSENSVIHTVKHGGSPISGDGKSDWWSNDECKRFADQLGKTFAKGSSLASSSSVEKIRDPEYIYNVAYRHFDNLIWQVPAWSTAMFMVIVASANALLATKPGKTINLITELLHLSKDKFAAYQLGLFGLFTLVLSYALFRFRWHQIGAKTWSKTAKSPISPQTLLQIIVNVEAILLLFLSTTLFKIPIVASGLFIVIIIGFLTWHWESILRKRNRELNPPRQRRTDKKDPSEISGAS